MKRILPVVALVAAAMSFGCGQKEPDTSSVEPVPTSDAPAAAQAAPAASPTVAATLTRVDTAIKSGAVDQAAASLLAVRNSGQHMTVDQSLQVNDRMRELQVRIAEMMASGDPRAQQAAKLLQANQPR